MKKFLCFLITFILITSCFSMNVSADSYFKVHINWKKSDMQDLKKIKEELKRWHNDFEKRMELIEEIMKLKEKNKDSSVSIFIGGNEFKPEDSPAITYKDIFLPVKPITAGLGADLKYDAKNELITITKGNTTIVINLAAELITTNGSTIRTKTLFNSNDNKILTLISFIAKALGYSVDIDNKSNTIIIEDHDYISINDNDPTFDYNGKWTYEKNIYGAHMGDIHQSNKKGSNFTFKFNGTRIKVYGSKGPDHGFATFSVNGNKEKVNLYAPVLQNNVLLYTSKMLKKGPHNLIVKVDGSKDKSSKGYYVTVDKVEISGDKTITPSNDVALKKTAFSDSYEASNPPSYGNDGNLNTRWCAKDGAVNHWWAADLGGNYNLTGTQIIWEFANKIYKYKVETSADGSNWITVVNKSDNTSIQQTQTDSFIANSVRFVRVTVTGLEPSCWASFLDFKAFGTPTSSSDGQAPTVPTGFSASPVSTSQIILKWNASSDNVGVAGYKLYRDGKYIATITNGLAYADTLLQPGTAYNYAIEAFDAAGNSSAKSSALKVSTYGSGTGLLGQYYDNIDFTNVKIARSDSTINFNWELNSPDSSIEADTFSIRWSGKIQPLFSEKYTFYAVSDDGIRVYINDRLVIDDWSGHSSREAIGTIDLQAGQKYNIKVEYYENSGYAQSQLMWSSASQAKQIIPQSQLYLQ